jgi:serine acetyltransferase
LLDKLKRDYARSSKNKKTLIVMAIYRAGNELFYSNLNGVLKRPLMLLLKIAKFLFVEIPYGTELPFETKIGGGLELDHAKGAYYPS